MYHFCGYPEPGGNDELHSTDEADCRLTSINILFVHKALTKPHFEYSPQEGNFTNGVRETSHMAAM